MSVIVTLRFEGDAKALEQYAADNPGALRAVVEHAVQHGVIAHRFYGAEGGKLMVIDEWPDAASFQEFFQHMESHIGPIMQAAQATEPEVTFWEKLDTGDDYGWD